MSSRFLEYRSAAYRVFCTVAAIALLLTVAVRPAHAQSTILNVSYDPTRELYKEYNVAFAKYWQATTHQAITVQQSHGGSGSQARAVVEGLSADVVTLALPYDIDSIAKSGLIAPNWQSRLPNNSTPYTSTVLILVRKGNPKGIHDWSDLTRPGIQVITPNPKTSGGARYAFLAAYGYALLKNHHNDAAARAFVSKLYQNVPILDSGSRGATITFCQRGQGDALLCWENEAYLAKEEFGAGNFDIVIPSITILATPPVAVVDQNAAAHKTTAVATAYLKYLYSKEGQTIAAKHFYRPIDKAVEAQFAAQFPKVRTFTVDKMFGGWTNAQHTYFDDGGVFDQIYAPH
jgi:sulfate/thiosulfate transport system substrate-binding protein